MAGTPSAPLNGKIGTGAPRDLVSKHRGATRVLEIVSTRILWKGIRKIFHEPFDASASDENVQSTKRIHENNGAPSFKQGWPHVNAGSWHQEASCVVAWHH